MDSYENAPREKLSPIRIVGRVIKYFIYAVVLIYIGLLFWRLFSSGDSKIAKTFVWTESAISAYNSNPNAFIVKSVSTPDDYSSDGIFRISNVRYVESIGQVQATVRYNDSALKTIAEKYELDSVPSGEAFVFAVKDNLGNIYTDYEYVSDEKNVLNYRRVVFSGIDMASVSTLTLNIYYINDVALTDPYSSLPLYTALKAEQTFDISKEMFSGNSVTSGLSARPGYGSGAYEAYAETEAVTPPEAADDTEESA